MNDITSRLLNGLVYAILPGIPVAASYFYIEINTIKAQLSEKEKFAELELAKHQECTELGAQIIQLNVDNAYSIAINSAKEVFKQRGCIKQSS